MAQTGYIEIPVGTDEQYLKVMKSSDRFLFSKIIRNDTLISKRKKAGISARSKFTELSAIWNAFSNAEREAWNTAGGYSNQHGWNLFVQDTCARWKQDITGVATPVIQHQVFVGAIVIGGTATEIKLLQTHPHTYWVNKKVVGKKAMYEPKEVIENFGLPLEIGISYYANLTASGANPTAKFYANVVRSYQAKEEISEVAITMNLQQAWTIETATLLSGRGILIGYNLYIELKDVQGTLYFDNVKSTHNATNWARDKNCNQIETVFTKAFSQIPKHWVAMTQPNGAEYDSIYI